MRNKFSEVLSRLATKNKKIYIVVADISPAGKMETFQKKFKNRYFNVGVAEQGMVGLAAGLAIKGAIPFIYTIAPFVLYRPFEMVRDDLCYQNLPVTIVGMGSGTIYSSLGGTHMTQEDVSVCRSLPNLRVLCPSDPYELEECIKFCSKNKKGPIYLRIGKSGEKNLGDDLSDIWKYGKIRKIFQQKYKAKKKICILGYGPILKLALDIKSKFKLNFSLYSSHTIKPFDTSNMKKIFNKYDKIITLEDHSEIGGLASIVNELAFKYEFSGKIKNFSLKDKFINSYEKQSDLLDLHGISLKKLYKEIKNA